MPESPNQPQRDHLPARLFAIIPAAGHSRRMGRPKLLLPLEGKPIIHRLLQVLDRADIVSRFVVVRPDDDRLADAVRQFGGTLLQPSSAPPDMRASVQCALTAIEERFSPSPQEGWLLVPADHPILSASVLDRLVDHWHRCASDILVPTCAGRRGHPAIFRWALAAEVPQIPSDRGLNWLVDSERRKIAEIPIEDPAVITDLDTPEDYAALAQRSKSRTHTPPNPGDLRNV